MLEQMEKDIDVWGSVEDGNLKPITEWLGKKIHQYGKLKKPQELLLNAMGGELDPLKYTGYLKKKFGELYGI